MVQVALKERGIDKLLEEAREDNKENDVTYMGRKCKMVSNPMSHLLPKLTNARKSTCRYLSSHGRVGGGLDVRCYGSLHY